MFVCNFGHSGPTWLPGIIIEARGDLTFHIELNDGRVFRRHINHIRHRTCAPSSEHTDENTDDFLPSPAGNVNNHPHTIANALLHLVDQHMQHIHQIVSCEIPCSFQGGRNVVNYSYYCITVLVGTYSGSSITIFVHF